jgi:hypothetical protein
MSTVMEKTFFVDRKIKELQIWGSRTLPDPTDSRQAPAFVVPGTYATQASGDKGGTRSGRFRQDPSSRDV